MLKVSAVGDESIMTIAEHPFWVVGQGWTPAHLLQPGDQLRDTNGTHPIVGSVIPTGNTTTVYNLHNYYVGVGKTHNQCVIEGAAKGAGAVADDWPVISGIVRSAAKCNGNFGIGSGTAAQAETAGRAWVGDGARLASDGKTWLSQDGLRQWRTPSYKPRLDKRQSNFESRWESSVRWQTNRQLDILDMP